MNNIYLDSLLDTISPTILNENIINKGQNYCLRQSLSFNPMIMCTIHMTSSFTHLYSFNYTRSCMKIRKYRNNMSHAQAHT